MYVKFTYTCAVCIAMFSSNLLRLITIESALLFIYGESSKGFFNTAQDIYEKKNDETFLEFLKKIRTLRFVNVL